MCRDYVDISWRKARQLYTEVFIINSNERREARYQRRQARRKKKLTDRNKAIGSIEDVFTFDELYQKGLKCCNGVRWKASVQNFEAALVTRTAKIQKALYDGTWKPHAYVKFSIFERGKTRYIEAPRIEDRQVHKVFTQKVLWPLYLPFMIHNNGASLPGKGLDFTRRLLKKDLVDHIRKYGLNGNIIVFDFSQYFPSVSHELLLERHKKFIFDERLRAIADEVVTSTVGITGLPLGVEPSQAEMIAFPSPLDNFIKCQLSLKGAGHYMDDYYVLVPPDRDVKDIASKIMAKISELRLIVKPEKMRVTPFKKGFTFCKARYRFAETGKILVLSDKSVLRRNKRRLKKLRAKIDAGDATYSDAFASMNGMLSHLARFDNYKKLCELRRFSRALFGFANYPEYERKVMAAQPLPSLFDDLGNFNPGEVDYG